MMNAAFLFITTIFLTVVNIFNITYKGNEINRIVTNLPLQILKSNVVIEEYTEDDFVAYFSKKETEESVKNYLNLSFKGIIDKYNLSFYYYFINNNKEYEFDMSDKPKAFQLHFNCTYYKNYKVDRYLNFTIEDIGSNL
ncbi:MAG: hypothetical protein MR606_00215 [Mollicutes bacterium]|nr:hypothetical protein [Mollicutes bacterium]MDD7263939.1 hypothetical protein [bacterium]